MITLSHLLYPRETLLTLPIRLILLARLRFTTDTQITWIRQDF